MMVRFYNKIAFYITCSWAVLEICACIIVLISGNEEYTDNFLKDLCSEPCGHFIQYAILIRLLAAGLLLLGNIYVSEKNLRDHAIYFKAGLWTISC